MQTSFTSTVAVAGTPQRLTSGATPSLPTVSGVLSGTVTPRGTYIVVTADPANTAAKTLWIGGSSLNVAGNSGWAFKLAPGASQQIVIAGQGTTDAGDFFVDTDGTVAKYGVEVVG